jgi:DNA-binding NtrC family response regulator
MIDRSKRILVIDDEAWWCDLIQSLLTERGMDVTSTAQLEQGLTETGKGEYDIVLISDRVLENPTQEARLRHVLDRELGHKIVLVSAAPDWQRTRQAFLLGAADHITKSTKADQVWSALAPHIRCPSKDAGEFDSCG